MKPPIEFYNQRETEVHPERFTSSDFGIVTVLFVIALGLRWYNLTALDLRFDEVAILLQTSLSYSEIWEFCKLENFPPLYPWIIKFLNNYMHDPVQLRWFSAIVGALVPPIAYLLGKEIQGRKLGLLLGLATIVSLPLLYFSQVVRMYSLFVLAGMLFIWGS